MGRIADEAASVLASSSVARPLFCDLLGHTPLNLERNVSVERVRAFKISAVAEVGAVADGRAATRYYVFMTAESHLVNNGV